MGTNTLATRANNQIIDQTWYNDFNTALSGDFVGRVAGAPTAGQNLGNITYPWGTIRGTSLVIDGSTIDFAGLTGQKYKILSGAKRSTSNQPLFLDPAGAAGGAVCTLLATTTPIAIEANGVEATVSADVTISSLTTAPSSNNTCLVDETHVALDSRTVGESWRPTRPIIVDTMGSEITALVGKWAAFKVASTEYFWAFVESSTRLTNVRRGYFYNSSGTPSKRLAIANNDTITLLKATWIFLDTAGTVDKTTVQPYIDATTPAAPSTGDYWFDLVNQLWKRYDGASFVTVSRVLIGLAVCDTTDCVAARSFDFDAAFSEYNGIDLERTSNTVVKGKNVPGAISVAGNLITFQTQRPNWDIATDLAGTDDMYDATEQASRPYYLYIKDTGQEVISDWAPYPRQDMRGWYHPHNPWRCVGFVWNDGSSNFSSPDIWIYQDGIARPRRRLNRQSSGVSTDSTTSATYVDTASLAVTITTNGGPVRLTLMNRAAGGAGLPGKMELSAAASAFLIFARGATEQGEYNWQVPAVPAVLPVSLNWQDVGVEGVPGIYTYKIRFKTSAGTFTISNVVLIAEEFIED